MCNHTWRAFYSCFLLGAWSCLNQDMDFKARHVLFRADGVGLWEGVEKESGVLKIVTGLLVALLSPFCAMAYYDVGEWRVDYIAESQTAILKSYRGSSSSVTIPDKITIKVFDHTKGEYNDVVCDVELGDWLFADNASIVSVSLGGQTHISTRCFNNCSSLKIVNGSFGLREVGYGAFYGCGSLVSIPSLKSVRSIGGEAFRGCGKLAIDVDWPDVSFIGGGAFKDCNSLYDAVNLPNATTIEDEAFLGCTSLTSVSIKNVSALGNCVFEGCTSISNAQIFGSTDIKGGVFLGCANLRKVELSGDSTFKDFTVASGIWGVSTRKISPFEGCENLEEVILGNRFDRILDRTFRDLKQLKKVAIDCEVKQIDYEAFSGCSELVDFPPLVSVTNIGGSAFSGCTSLTSVVAHQLKELGGTVFDGCSSLSSVSLDGSALIHGALFRNCKSLKKVEILGNISFSSNDYSRHDNCPFYGCASLMDVVLGDGVGFLPRDVFKDMLSLTNVVVSQALTDVFDEAFMNCSSLESFEGFATVSNVGANAFANCKSLVGSVEMPVVERIGTGAFVGCTSMTLFTAEMVQELGGEVFSGCVNLEVCRISGDAAIQYGAFSRCRSLRSVELLGNMRFADSFSPPGWSWTAPPFVGCTNLVEVVLGEGFKRILPETFTSLVSLTNVRVTASLKEICSKSFNGSTALRCVDGAEAVTIVGDSAFSGCSSLESFEGFATVSNVGANAFANCKSLVGSVEMPVVERIGTGAFVGCTSMTLFTAEMVQELGGEVFSGCVNLEVCRISGDAAIQYGAFSRCRSLRSVELLGNMRFADSFSPPGWSWTAPPFVGCTNLVEVVLGEGFKRILPETFTSLVSLTNVRVTASLKEICSKSFSGCSSLGSFEGFATVTNIGSSAFSGCTSLTSVVAHQLKELGECVFDDCSSLSSVSLDGSALIHGALFRNCKSLKKVEILGDISFSSNDYYRYGNRPFYGCASLMDVRLGEGVAFLPRDTFIDRSTLTNVTVTSSLADIYDGAFANCSSLQSVIGADSVRRINGSAFLNCSSLKSFEGFATVTNIGSSAFSGCSSLTGKVELAKVKTVESGTFKGCERIRQVKLGKDLEVVRADAFSGSTNLIAFTFEGLPPEADNNAFRNVKKGALGIYPTSTLQFEDSQVVPQSVQPLSETSDEKKWCDVIAEDGTWKKLLMCPNKPILTNDVYYVDKGSLRLNWETNMPPKEYELTYEIRRGFSDNYDTADILTNGYKELTYIDKQFDFTGGVSRIWYWVKPEHPELKDDELQHSDACRTKNRYCLTAGTVDLGGFNDSKLFVELAGKKGGFLSYKPLIDPTFNEIDKAINDVLPILKPGDIYVIYMAAHGIESGDDSYLLFEGRTNKHSVSYRYSASQLKTVSEAVAERNARFIGVIMSCHSQAMIKDGRIVKENERLEQFCNGSCGEGSNDLIAWITSSRKEQFSYTADSTTYTRFGNSFLRYGWGEGYADLDLFIEGKQEKLEGHNDDRITLLEMAHYAAVMAVGGFADFFRWAAMSSIDGNSSVYIQNPELLSRIDMGEVTGTHVSGNIDPPSHVFLVNSSIIEPSIMWTPVPDAESYRVYRYLEDPTKPQSVHLEVKGLSTKDELGRGLLNRTAYKYYVQSENPAGISKRSMIAVEEFWNDSGIDINDFKDSLSKYGLDMSKVDEEEVDRIASEDLDGDGVSVANEFIAGVSPIDVTSQFTANITMENGIPKVTPVPDLGDARKYTIYGKTDLDNSAANWTDMSSVPEEDKSQYRFFKVDVSLP